MATNEQIALAKKIDARATELARGVEREIVIQCGGKTEFSAIILEAVARKIMRMARDATINAADEVTQADCHD